MLSFASVAGDIDGTVLDEFEAVKAGFYDSPLHGKVPKLQILTIDELFTGKKPQIPFGVADPASFKKAAVEGTTSQGKLF